MGRALILTVSMLLLNLSAGSLQAASLSETIRQLKPSIVGIGTYLPSRRPAARLMGTGFVVGNGYQVVTNHHVANVELDLERNERLIVFSGVGKQAKSHPATILRSSPRHDLAVLRIGQALPPLKLAEADLAMEGEDIAFTGFPIGSVLGLYPATHKGLISAITPIAIPSPSSRQLKASKINRLRNPIEVYQLDATAYPGNSGSPVYRPDTGEVVGVLNQVFVKSTKEDVLSKPSGISYAIPIKHLNGLIGQ
ncbi:S1 family peptidase [Motiliproteus sp.]|uniref:S1 family peptidase n=1 Tax=Motiliproteus sp. TaxID=1898955 RepID=UPI003BA84EB0